MIKVRDRLNYSSNAWFVYFLNEIELFMLWKFNKEQLLLGQKEIRHEADLMY